MVILNYIIDRPWQVRTSRGRIIGHYKTRREAEAVTSLDDDYVLHYVAL